LATWAELITDEHMEMLLRLGAAMLAGMVIGLNRDLQDKPMGMRTLGVVSLSAAVVVLAGSSYGNLRFDQDAVSRVIQGILTGLGFLGAGVILRERDKLEIHGLTTAATVMVAATVGITAGLGAWFLTFAGTVMALTLLVFGKPVEIFFARVLKGRKPRQRSNQDVKPHQRDGRDSQP
jgi:putative Mg2+ transporter-C (MgtC) family protein